MKKIILSFLLALCFIVPAKAQTQGVVFGGYYAGFGYSAGPEFGVGLETYHKNFGLQTYGSIILSPKVETGNGITFEGQIRPIYHIKPKFGLTGHIDYSALTTSLFHKAALYPGGGIVYSPDPIADLYLEYFQQVQPKINMQGIEANKIKGVQVMADLKFYSWFKLRETVNFGHVYTQGNPLCDGTDPGPITCPRSTTWAEGFEVQAMFLFK